MYPVMSLFYLLSLRRRTAFRQARKGLQAKVKADVVDIDALWDRAEEGGEYDDERTMCRHRLLHMNLWSGRSCLRLGLCGGGANRGPSAFRCENVQPLALPHSCIKGRDYQSPSHVLYCNFIIFVTTRSPDAICTVDQYLAFHLFKLYRFMLC